MMKIRVDAAVCGLDGKPLADANGAVVLRAVCIEGLMGVFPDEQNLDAVEKVRRWKLAQRIHDQTEVDLSAEEVALLKKLIGKGYGPVVVGPAWNMLDPESS